jgi:hypothetical protein
VVFRLGWLPFTSESVRRFTGGQAEMAIVAWWGRTLPLSWRTHLVRIVFVIIGAPPVNRRFTS